MRAVIYCRVSTKEQAKNLSLPAQRKACPRFCRDQGWKVDRVFVERGESAKTAERTELRQRLIGAFVHQQSLDPETYRREMDRIREQEVLTDVELHENRMDELDVEGVLALAEHVVLNARRLSSEYDLKRRRHLRKVLFPSGVHFDGEGFGAPVTCLFLNSLEAEKGMESQMASPRGTDGWKISMDRWSPMDPPNRAA